MKNNNKIIELKNICKEYDGVLAVDDFNLYVKKGEFVTFLGPSGCGKTTTLRMIAGFEMPTSGVILLNGEDISKLPPYEKQPLTHRYITKFPPLFQNSGLIIAPRNIFVNFPHANRFN